MKNKLKVVMLLLLSVCTLTACGKTKKSDLEFVEMMESRNFTVTDCTDQYADNAEITNVQVAIEPGGNYQVEFYTLDTEENAVAFFNSNYEILSAFEEDSKNRNSSSSSTKKMQSFELTGEEGFYCITRVENTVFYSVINKEYKDAVKEIKKDLDY